jgi:hypothetical protein
LCAGCNEAISLNPFIMTYSFSFSPSTLTDVLSAFNNRSMAITEMGQWIYSVDPETFAEVKSAHLRGGGDSTLLNAFKAALKAAKA